MRGGALGARDCRGKGPLPGGFKEGFRVRRVQCGRRRSHYEAAGDHGEIPEDSWMKFGESVDEEQEEIY